MTAKRRVVLFGTALLVVSAGLASLAWSQLPSLPELRTGGGETQLPAFEPADGAVPPVRSGGEWTVVPGMEAMPLPAESVEAAIAIYSRLVYLWRLTGDETGRARGLAFLAGLEGSIGRVRDSERHYGEARALLESRSQRSEDLAWLHNNQGLSRANRRAHAAALESFRLALDAFPEGSDRLLEERALVEQNRATSHFALGDVEAAEEGYLSALELLDRLQGSRRVVATLLQNLAGLYTRMGDFDAAETQLRRSLDVAPVSDRLLNFSVLNNLGDALRAQGRHKEAEARFQEASERLTGALDGRRLVVLNRLLNFWEAGDLEAVEALLGEARELFRDSGTPKAAAPSLDVMAGRLAFARGQFERADQLFGEVEARLREQSAGEARFLAEVLAERSLVADRLGDRSRALASGREAFELERAQLDQILAFGSELQRLEYQRQARPLDHLAILGDASLLAEAVLTTKGAVLDSLMVERRAVRAVANDSGRVRLDQIRELRQQLLSARAEGADEAALETLSTKLKSQETALARSVGRTIKAERAAIRVEQVRGALVPGAVLIELLEYRAVEPGGHSVPSFGALVIPSRGQVRWLPLGATEGVAEALDSLLQGVSQTARGTARPPSRENQAPAGALELLSSRLWRPIAAVLPPALDKIVVAPDGILHFVPWAALLDTKDRFVAERFEVLTLSTGRDLLVRPPGPPDKTMLVLGDGRGDLPSARVEAEWLDREAAKQGWESTLLLGEAATEPALRVRKSPSVLHLATHGGVLEAAESETIQARLSSQPMYRGFLMLGGTNATLRAWREGRVIPVAHDGILTAEEIASLDLEATDLTVLSACDTGRGESRGGEGILGLRRGFALAGSRELLFTLWPVDDRFTAVFMTDFYSAFFTQGQAAAAFSNAQRNRLSELRRSEGVVAAVRLAGGFVFGR